LNPPPTYYGKRYDQDFAVKDPAQALREALLGPSLKCSQHGIEIQSRDWLDMEVWDRPGVKFLRSDVLRYRKQIDPTAAVQRHSKKAVSEARAKELYFELQAKNEGHIGLNAFYDIAKLDGVTREQAKVIHSELDPTAHDLGRKKKAGKAPKIPQ
jgi:hypothetical protein